MYAFTIGARRYAFGDLKTLLAKATPLRSGDQLAGIAAESGEERVAAQYAIADLPLATFLSETVVPYEDDEVTRLIVDSHDRAAFALIAHLTVGDLRDWLLSDAATPKKLAALAPGVMPEMAAAVAKISGLQDLMVMAAKCSVVTRFRSTIGLPGRLAVRLQPNHPADDPRGIAASILDGLLLGAGDAVIGINPATDSPARAHQLLDMLDEIRARLDIPTQSCVLAHVTTTLALMRKRAPVDLVFQSIAGTQDANRSFGIDLALLAEARAAALALRRGTIGDNVMYFETGQGSALSANAHHDVDQQTLEARAYAVARAFKPLLVNTVVGFIGPEYLYDGKQITRAGLEDHFCGKLMGVPMGVDVCYTNHAEADQDDMDALLALLVAAGVSYVMGVPGADDIMLGYQSTSFHDALAMRDLFGRRPAPEFEAWLAQQGLMDAEKRIRPRELPAKFKALLPDPARRPRALSPQRRGEGAHALSVWLEARPMKRKRAPTKGTSPPPPPPPDLWPSLRQLTAARIGLARSGASLATGPTLDFRLAHARARDAVHAPLDATRLLADLAPLGLPMLAVASAAQDRARYLMRPDLGRRLAPDATAVLAPHAGAYDLAVMIADGLSARAVQVHAAPLLAAALPHLADWCLAPLVVVRHGRVAIGDAVAAALGAPCVAILIGERPGLTAPDSMGAYLTWQPAAQTTDAERNCISNIRPEGIGYADAAQKLIALLRAIRARRVSGVRLKDESDGRLIEGT